MLCCQIVFCHSLATGQARGICWHMSISRLAWNLSLPEQDTVVSFSAVLSNTAKTSHLWLSEF